MGATRLGVIPATRARMPDDVHPPVRVVGYAHVGDRYGRLGAYPAEIVATEIVYLDPTRAECR